MHYIGQGIRDKATVLEGLLKAIEHHKKYGFSLGSVFDKVSHTFIGRAGLIHIEFKDENDIEIAYAFHQIFWNKGYGSEIARALLKWGLSHLPNRDLVAIVHAQNQKSRRVLEKIGMHFVEQDGDKVQYRISPVNS
jgi:RimJ/RimL family protein N-acetyltransferase